jgi:uncharacterized membrane protein
MTQSIAGIFDTREQAERVVQALIDAGISRDQISLLTRADEAEQALESGSDTGQARNLTIGAVGGGVMGGTLGTLVGMLAIGVPGIGPIVAAGPIAAVLSSYGASMVFGAGVGAVGGGLLGGLAWAGVPKEEAHIYSEAIRRGNMVILVQSDNNETVIDILHAYGAVNAGARYAEWRQEIHRDDDPSAGLEDVRRR